MLYRGYVECKGKQSIQKIKDSSLSTLDEVRKKEAYAGVLRENVVMVDIDDKDEAEALFKVLEYMGIKTNVLETNRGLHFYFEAPRNNYKIGCSSHTETLVGITADYKCGPNAYDCLKIDYKERVWRRQDVEKLEVLPPFLYHGKAHLYGMKDGDGRDDTLYRLIPSLQKVGMNKDDIRRLYEAINKYVFKDKMTAAELGRITRDEAFIDIEETKKKSSKTCYKTIAEGFIQEYKIKYVDGVYFADDVMIDKIERMRMMLEYDESLTIKGRAEVESIMEIITPRAQIAPPHYIKFTNGIYDADTGLLMDEEKYQFQNKIEWPYDDEAYDATMDYTLNKICCYDDEVRLVLEELIGYCMIRDCTLRKAFILYGTKRNGKSSFLRSLIKLLGAKNITTLDMRDLSRQFATVNLHGKLANIGDDISSSYIDDTSILKKIISGEWMTVDRKFKDAFSFRNYAKLVFSANDLGAFKDESGAMLDRLIVIPFDAYFSETDDDFNPNIERDMTTDSAIKYLIRIGIKGLERVLQNNGFSRCQKSEDIKDLYRLINNPIEDYFDNEIGDFIGKPVQEAYMRYREYCGRSGNNNPYSRTKFSQLVNNRFKTKTVTGRFGDKTMKVFKAM